MSTEIVEIPALLEIKPFPALGSANYNQEAYDNGVSVPPAIERAREIVAAGRVNALAAKEKAESASQSLSATTVQADLVMGYRNQAGQSATAAAQSAGQAAASETQTAADVVQTGIYKKNAEAAALSVSEDAAAVAAALAAASAGPVASFNGRGGLVTLNGSDVIGVIPQASAQELAQATEKAVRSFSPEDIRAAVMGSAVALSGVLPDLLPSEFLPGEVIESGVRTTPKWIKLGENYLRTTYPITADMNVDRAPAQQESVQVIGSTVSMPWNAVASDHERGIIFLASGSNADVAVFVNRTTGQYTKQTLSRSGGGVDTSTAKFAPDGSIWAISYDSAGGAVNMRVYSLNNGVYSEYAYRSFVSRSQAPGAFSSASDYMVALSKDTLLVGQASAYQLGAVYKVSAGTIALGTPVLDIPPSPATSAHFIAVVSLSPDGQYLFAYNSVPENGAQSTCRMYKRTAGTDNFTALAPLPSIPGVSWSSYSTPANCSTWLSGNLLMTFNSVFLEMAGTSIIGTNAPGFSGGSFPAFPVNAAKTRYRYPNATDLTVSYIDVVNKFVAPVPVDDYIGPMPYTYQNSVPSQDRRSFYAISTSGQDIRLTKYSATATFAIRPLLAMPKPAVRSQYMRTYDY